jgi:hypothetical protein
MELIIGFVITAVVFALAWFSKVCRPIFAALWLCIFCLLGDLLAIGLIVSPQGQDFLIAFSASGDRWHRFWFFSSLVALSLSSWACARALMYRLGQGMPHWIVAWFPRILGLAPLVVVLFVSKFGLRDQRFTNITIILTLLFTAFVFLRRPVVEKFGKSKTPMPFHGTEVGPGMKWTLGVALTVSLVLFVLFWIDPVRYPQAFGAPSLALLAATSWVLFGSVILMLLPRSYGWPSIAWLPIVLAFGASWSNENFRVRELAPAATPPVQTAAAKRAKSLAADFDDWIAQRRGEIKKPYPVFIVAAEGGGVRAAYWTASVLTRLQAEDPAFARHVYAISGVSGGSLGGATFVALLQAQKRNQLKPCKNPDDDHPPAPLYDCAQAFLGYDFMSPALAYLLYEDLMQRFLFVPIPALSRANALEQAWERGWTEATKSDIFAEPFSRLWEGDNSREIPALFLNGTIVESGNRIITSNVPINNYDLPDAIGTFDEDVLNPRELAPFSARMRVSTAVHMSARFTYVSPPGRLMYGENKRWGHVIDGGYFENSGGATGTDIFWRLMEEKKTYPNIVPVLILVTNSPASFAEKGHPVAGKPVESLEFLTDLRAPLFGLTNTREARGRYAVAQIRNGETATPRRCVVNFGLRAADGDGHNPILGWFLAKDSRMEMRNQLNALDGEVQKVRTLLSSGRCQ